MNWSWLGCDHAWLIYTMAHRVNQYSIYALGRSFVYIYWNFKTCFKIAQTALMLPAFSSPLASGSVFLSDASMSTLTSSIVTLGMACPLGVSDATPSSVEKKIHPLRHSIIHVHISTYPSTRINIIRSTEITIKEQHVSSTPYAFFEVMWEEKIQGDSKP